ncbi:hypothetical protein FOTG_17432 [Fusarium oxysporum f. sp. vasinfectum 25433]|uniref:Uncharacterized protein n=1 Tax=Fusarium oxysporum f. sp. vasinfectum 25433 TaxID=1089449 RepID=X0KKK5_FUSOX|nr:hypothetical protein FOTG_17432 [Fusarium oxysporum f. sp. vasinfectum 25433]
MGTSSCILIYYEGKFRACQTYSWDGGIGGQGAYIFKFLSSPKRTKALKKGLKHTTYISMDQYGSAKWEIERLLQKGDLLDDIRTWGSFCTEYTSHEPSSLYEAHDHVDACSGPAVLKLISIATAENQVTLVHPAFFSTPTAQKNLEFVHSRFAPESNIHNIDLDELKIEKLGIDDIIMKDFDMDDFDVDDYDYAYMIDLDKSTLKVYEWAYDPVCKYTFGQLQSFTEAEFIGHYKEAKGEKNPDNMPKYKVMLAGSLCHNSRVNNSLDLDKRFEVCSAFHQKPTHLVCTSRQFLRRKGIKEIRDAMDNRIPICKYSSSNNEWMNLDKKNNILWHPKYGYMKEWILSNGEL